MQVALAVAGVRLLFKSSFKELPIIARDYPTIMEFKAFTLAEAEEICEDFEDLTDTEFKIGSSPMMLIEAVVVAPFSEADKNRFTDHFSETKDKETALSWYTGSDYDVLLITTEDDNDLECSYIDIRTFADLRGIKYSFPE